MVYFQMELFYVYLVVKKIKMDFDKKNFQKMDYHVWKFMAFKPNAHVIAISMAWLCAHIWHKGASFHAKQ